jgi:hypothetical protein
MSAEHVRRTRRAPDRDPSSSDWQLAATDRAPGGEQVDARAATSTPDPARPDGEASDGARQVVSGSTHSLARMTILPPVESAAGPAGGPLSPETSGRIEAARGDGAALDAGTRASMEGAFGTSFANVRIHADGEADTLNHSVGARAFTTGSDIFFRQGTFQPDTDTGRHLLAHELTHVVQQQGSSVGGPMTVGAVDDRSEQEADAAAASVARSPDASAASPVPTSLVRRSSLTIDAVVGQPTAPQLAAASSQIDTAGPPQPVLQRFGSEEHRDIAHEAVGSVQLSLDIGDPAHPLLYEEMVALAGDLFLGLDQMKELAKSDDGKAQIRFAREYALKAPKADPPVSDDVKKAVKDRYFTLVANNISHFSFGGTARNHYEKYHEDGLAAAFMFGASGDSKQWSKAMLSEAFGNHYLTDMFAAGHVRTPRAEIKKWYKDHYPDDIKRIVSYMAHYLVDRLDSYGETKWWLSIGSLITKGHTLTGYIELRIKEMGGKALESYSLGDIVSLGYHNQDNKGLGVISDVDPSGVPVPGGFPWLDVGDSHLQESTITKEMVVAAVQASLQELDLAREAGAQAASSRCLSPEELTMHMLAFRDSIVPYAAEKYVPRVDQGVANPEMKWEWGALDPVLRAAVDHAVKHDIGDEMGNMPPPDDEHGLEIKRAFKELVKHIQDGGITVLEKALDKSAAPLDPPSGSKALDKSAGPLDPPSGSGANDPANIPNDPANTMRPSH